MVSSCLWFSRYTTSAVLCFIRVQELPVGHTVLRKAFWGGAWMQVTAKRTNVPGMKAFRGGRDNSVSGYRPRRPYLPPYGYAPYSYVWVSSMDFPISDKCGCIFCSLVLWALHWCLFLQCVGSHVYVNICNYACQQLLSFFSDDAHLRDDVGFCFMFLDDVYRASEDEVGSQCVVALATTRIFSLKQSRHICM